MNQTFLPGKKRSSVVMRTLFPCDFNKNAKQVRDIVVVVKDFDQVPPSVFEKFILSYCIQLGLDKKQVAELMADGAKYQIITKATNQYSVRIVATDSGHEIKLAKWKGYTGLGYETEKTICEFEHFNAPTNLFSVTSAGIYQVMYTNPIEEMQARISAGGFNLSKVRQ